MSAAVSQYVEPSLTGWTKAAAAAVTVAVAGLGAGAATERVDLGINDSRGAAKTVLQPDGKRAAVAPRAAGGSTSSISQPTTISTVRRKATGTTVVSTATTTGPKLAEQPTTSEPPAPEAPALPDITPLIPKPAEGPTGSGSGTGTGEQESKIPDAAGILTNSAGSLPSTLPPIGGADAGTAVQDAARAIGEILPDE
jgi:hypothetical protein